MDNYYDSAEGVTITQNRALVEVLDHRIDIWEFLSECGDLPEYDAHSVLNWLGY